MVLYAPSIAARGYAKQLDIHVSVFCLHSTQMICKKILQEQMAAVIVWPLLFKHHLLIQLQMKNK